MSSFIALTAVLALGGPATASVLRPVRHDFMHAAVDRAPLYARADAGSKSSPITLIPIRPNNNAKKHRRDTSGPFDLIPQDALYWAGEDGTVAELVIDMPGDEEAIVDMEYFDDLIEGVTCPEGGDSIAIDFKDETNLEAAGEIWTWVNESEENHFYLMVGAGDCEWNENRFLFQVESMDITPDTKIATLVGQEMAWKEALHSYDLSIGNLAMGETVSAEGLSKRGFLDAIGDFFGGEFNPDVSVPLDTDLSGQSLTFNLQDGITLTGKCNECTTKGTIDAEAKFRVKWFNLEEAFVELRTGGLEAKAVVGLTMAGDLTDTLLSQSLPLFEASPAGIVIPGIVSIGPVVGVGLSAGISTIKGSVAVTAGGSATVPESKWKLDFLSEAGSVAEGWVPSLEVLPLEAQASVEVKATASLDASVGLELSVLGMCSASMREVKY